MKKFYLCFLIYFIHSNVNSQIYVENQQIFEWDTNFVQSIEGINEALTRIIASEQGICITTRKYKSIELNSMYKELHFFDHEMNYITTVLHGETGNSASFGGSEDIFTYNDYLYVLDFQSFIYSLDSMIGFHCFSKYNFGGELVASDTLWGFEYHTFYQGILSNQFTPINYRYINGDYVNYISLMTNTNDSERSLVRCNLNQATISVIPFDLGLNGDVKSFLDVSDSLFLIEKKQESGIINHDYFEQFDLSGNTLNTVFIGDTSSISNSSQTRDYIKKNDELSIIYRKNYETDRNSIEFINSDFEVLNSIDIHGTEYRTGRLLHNDEEQKCYLVLMPRYVNNYNYRLVEMDIPSQIITFDTTFAIPYDDYYTLNSARSVYINQEQGDFISYGVKLFPSNTPYLHRINVFERKAYFDSVQFAYNDVFQNVDFINIDYKDGVYYIVGHNPIASDDELHAYCIGKLSIPTNSSFFMKNDELFSISPNPVSNELFLTNLPDENLQIQIRDLQGRVLVSSKSVNQQMLQLPMYNLVPGAYLISVQGSNVCQTRKFIKN